MKVDKEGLKMLCDLAGELHRKGELQTETVWDAVEASTYRSISIDLQIHINKLEVMKE